MADKLEDEIGAILAGTEPAAEKKRSHHKPKAAPADKPPAQPATASTATQRARYKREAVTAIREVNSLLLSGPQQLQRWALSDDPKILAELGGKPPNETETLAGIVAGARVYYPQFGTVLEGGGKAGLLLSAAVFALMYGATRLGAGGLLRAIPGIGERLQGQFDAAQQHAAEQLGRMQAQAEQAYRAAMGVQPDAPASVETFAAGNYNGSYPEGL